MGDRITTYNDCPKCGGKGTFECYEALSSNMKLDQCSKCGHTVHYDFEEKDGVIHINAVETDTQGTDLQSLDSEANSRQADAPSGAGEKGRL